MDTPEIAVDKSETRALTEICKALADNQQLSLAITEDRVTVAQIVIGCLRNAGFQPTSLKGATVVETLTIELRLDTAPLLRQLERVAASMKEG